MITFIIKNVDYAFEIEINLGIEIGCVHLDIVGAKMSIKPNLKQLAK